jgi:hypothetical protein
VGRREASWCFVTGSAGQLVAPWWDLPPTAATNRAGTSARPAPKRIHVVVQSTVLPSFRRLPLGGLLLDPGALPSCPGRRLIHRAPGHAGRVLAGTGRHPERAERAETLRQTRRRRRLTSGAIFGPGGRRGEDGDGGPPPPTRTVGAGGAQLGRGGGHGGLLGLRRWRSGWRPPWPGRPPGHRATGHIHDRIRDEDDDDQPPDPPPRVRPEAARRRRPPVEPNHHGAAHRGRDDPDHADGVRGERARRVRAGRPPARQPSPAPSPRAPTSVRSCQPRTRPGRPGTDGRVGTRPGPSRGRQPVQSRIPGGPTPLTRASADHAACVSRPPEGAPKTKA